MRYRILVLMMIISLIPLSSVYAESIFVGRVADLDGRLFFQSGRSLEWMEGYVNSPVQEGDRLWTDLSTFAEIQLDGSLLLRLGPDTKIDILRMNSAETSVKVWIGSVALRCLHDVPRERPVALSSPDGVLNILTAGSYRTDSMLDNSSRFVVYQGVADLIVGGESLTLRTSEYSLMTADGGPPRIMRLSGVSDDLDRYCSARDKALTKPASSSHVPPAVTIGLYDLDTYGVWVYDPYYGYIWKPSVYSGWAPYRYGRWIWVAPWGWTWVSYEPWGWAPYHYGTWYYSAGGNWFWIPGQYYGPAWVAWSAHSTGVSWVALHPADLPPGGHHWHAHSSWSATINNPRNAHLHGGGSGTTFLHRADFENGRLIKSDADITMVPSDVSANKAWQPMPPQTLQPGPAVRQRESGPSALPGRTIGTRSAEERPDRPAGGTADRTPPTPTDRFSTERDPHASQPGSRHDSYPDRTSTDNSRTPVSSSDRYPDRTPGDRPTPPRDTTKPSERNGEMNEKGPTSTHQPPTRNDERDERPAAKPTPKPSVKPAAKPTQKPDDKASEAKNRK